MSLKKLTENIFCVNTELNDPNGRFEGIWAIPTGVTINSYIVRGEKTALIDVVLDDETSIQGYEKELAEIGVKFEDIDYLILNHLEPDHTGFLNELRERNSKAQIYASKNGIRMVEKFFKLTENLNAVKTGDELDLGGGVVLSFFQTPNVHWPETMMTYCEKDSVLFSCDGFGGYHSLGDKLFDDEQTEEFLKIYEHEALRYYSNIMASFGKFVLKAIELVSAKPIKILAPSHGIIWRKNPQYMIDLYKKFAEYNTGGKCEKEICVIWGSMYGYTKRGLDMVLAGIEEAGVTYTIHRLPEDDNSYLLADAHKSAGIVIAMPTYENKMFPPMAYFLDVCRRKHITDKTVLRIGSFGWGGGAKKEYEEITESLNWENLEQVEWIGVPAEEDYAKLKELGKELAKKVTEKLDS